MIALGIDTSNYATSIAVVDMNRMEVVCAKKQFLNVGKGQCGLRQSEAVFQHIQHLPGLLEQMKIEGANGPFDAVGVSSKPRPIEGSYMPCFLVGVSAASAAAFSSGVSLFKTSHQQGHLAAALFATNQLQETQNNQEYIVLHMSGGTTALLWSRGFKEVETLGGTLDLFAGQAIDRLGVRLGFSFPAGPEISRLAEEWPENMPVKASMEGCYCHLSGLQNQCEALLAKEKPDAYVARFCLLSIAEAALGLLRAGREKMGDLPILCVGGVMSSTIIKTAILEQLKDVYFVPPAYSSDNAVGVACIAGLERMSRGTDS